MKILLYFIFLLEVIVFSGCYTYHKILDKESDGSGYLSLSHYTSAIPTLGSCGFSRNSDVYDIKTPRINGKIESSELKILSVSDSVKYKYVGYIEFLKSNKVFVELYKINNETKTKLTINGKHKFKIKDDIIEK